MRKFFANLKAVVGAVVMVSMLSTAALSTSCSDYDEDIDNLQGQIDNLASRVDALEDDFKALAGALNGIVLDAEQDANGNWVITTDDGTINITVEGVDAGSTDGVVTVIEEDGAYYWAIVTNGEPTALLVNGEKVSVAVTPEVRVNPATNKTEISLDGTNWYAIGVVFEAVTIEGNNLVLTIGGQTVYVPMAQEARFEVASGKVYFAAEQSQTVKLLAENVEEMFVMVTPEGWSAEVEGTSLTVTAPASNPAYDPYDYWNTESPVLGEANGFVKVMAVTGDNKTLVGKLKVAVADDTVAVKAYNGTAYITVNSYYYAYAGACKKSELAESVAPTLDAMNNYGNPESYRLAQGENEIQIAELLGSEPVVGEEYVIWSIIDSYDSPYTIDDVVYCVYMPMNVEVNTTSVSSFDIQVEIIAEGVESYIAIAMPDDYYTPSPGEYGDGSAELMVTYFKQGDVYGKEYTTNYKGSLLGVAAGTQYAMEGYYGPGKAHHLLVLPIDGRPIEEYTMEDVIEIVETNSEESVGGDVTMEIEQVYQKKDYYGEMVDINAYNEIALSITPSENWYAIYHDMLSDDDLALLGDDEAIVDHLLTNTWPVLSGDAKETPIVISWPDLQMGETRNYVAVAMNAKGQYMEIIKKTFSTKDMEYSETLSLEVSGDDAPMEKTITLDITTNGTATKYRYANIDKLSSLWMYTYGENIEKAKEQLLMNSYSSWNNPSVELTAEDLALTNNQITISDLKFDFKYVFLIVGYDENDLPSQVATFEYSPLFYVGEITSTDDASYADVKPELVYNVMWEYNNYVNIDIYVKAAAGTEVTLFCDDVEYITGYADMTDEELITFLSTGRLSNYYMGFITPDSAIPADSWALETEGEYTGYYKRTFGYKRDASDLIYFVKSEAGYYSPIKIDLYDEITVAVANGKAAETLATQWNLPADVAALMAAEGAEGIVDLGQTEPGKMAIAFNLESIYGEEAAGQWQVMSAFDFRIEATDETSGNIVIMQTNMFDEVTETKVPYSGLSSQSVTIDFSFIGGGVSECTPYDGLVELDLTGGGAIM